MRDSSASINHVIQSLAASKLADEIPHMRAVGLEAQGHALREVKKECLKATALHNVSDEVLYTMLLLGMTTSWHVRHDIGLEYLALAGRAITARTEAQDQEAIPNAEFFQNALKYWKMIVSLVSNTVEIPNTCKKVSAITFGPSPSIAPRTKILPHPWTGISSEPQDLFGQVLRLIWEARAGTRKSIATAISRAGMNIVSSAINSAERLETECWRVSLPSIGDVEDTGDPCTPPLHHVLTAKAYLLAALLHIYMIFPDVLENHVRSSPPPGAAFQTSDEAPPAHVVSKAWLWPTRSAADHPSAWLRDIGLRVVECLESIGVHSSTRVVHPPLLLCVATALTLCGEVDNISEGDPSANGTDHHVRHGRAFIVCRLEMMQALMRFHAIDNILTVIREVWNRADAGAQDFFWMDVMSELHCESLFG